MKTALIDRGNKVLVTLRYKNDPGAGWGAPVNGWGLVDNSLIDWNKTYWFVTLLAVAVVVFLYLGYTSDLIRENARTAPQRKRTFCGDQANLTAWHVCRWHGGRS